MSYPPPPCRTVPISPYPLGDNCYSLYMEREQWGGGVDCCFLAPPPPTHTHNQDHGGREGGELALDHQSQLQTPWNDFALQAGGIRILLSVKNV